ALLEAVVKVKTVIPVIMFAASPRELDLITCAAESESICAVQQWWLLFRQSRCAEYATSKEREQRTVVGVATLTNPGHCRRRTVFFEDLGDSFAYHETD